MVCIYCKSQTGVINSRSSRKALSTWRRRRCIECHALFTTRELPDLENSLRVLKANGRLESFLRDKLFVSVFLSMSHRKAALSDASELTATIIKETLTHSNNGIIKSNELAHTAAKALNQFDPAAYAFYIAHHNG